MFSKVKCPNCGAKNPKERMVCIECGTPLASEPVKTQLSQVSTEAEVPDKTVIEKEPKEIVEDEYRDNEKVLYKTRGTLTLPGKEPEEADCFVTEGHVVIEAEELLKIPLSRVQKCDIAAEYPSIFFPTGTATLIFLDDLNKKHKLSLEIAAVAVGDFKQALAEHVEFPMDFLDKAMETFRDHTRDDICAGLRALGIAAKMAERGQAEEDIVGFSVLQILSSLSFSPLGGATSLGLINIPGGPIRWVNVRRVRRRGVANVPINYYYTDYGVPDPKLETKSPNLQIKSVRKKNFPLVGDVVDLHWEGEDSGLGIIRRLNSDISIKDPIMRSGDVTIRAYGESKCWIISTEWYPPPIETIFSPPSSLPSLQEQWDCYQAIAQHSLADWSTIK